MRIYILLTTWHVPMPESSRLTGQNKTRANIIEPRHDKMCLREFPTRPDTNRPAQPQKLARVLKFWAIEFKYIILSKQRTTKALIRLRGFAGWSVSLLFAYDIRHIFSWPGSIILPFCHIGIRIYNSQSKKISNDQELIQSDPISCPQNQKGNN